MDTKGIIPKRHDDADDAAELSKGELEYTKKQGNQRIPSKIAKEMVGLSASYLLAMSKMTSPHSNSPRRVLFLHGLCLIGVNQSIMWVPIVSFHPIINVVYHGCSKWLGLHNNV